jgi:hypothetical protein
MVRLQLPQKMNNASHRLRLMIGLRRLRRWKRKLQPILLALHQEQMLLTETQRRLSPKVMASLRLPPNLPVTESTLTWGLVTVEDLYLLVQELEKRTEMLLRSTSSRS